MKRLLRVLLASAVAIASIPVMVHTASAQVPCIGFGGVNSVPQIGIACSQEPFVPTFNAVAVALAPPASATDVACLSGSATRVVRVQEARVSGTSSPSITLPIVFTKRTALDTSGTAYSGALLTATGNMSTTVMDSGNTLQLAPTAIASAYTGNPTINDTSWGAFDTVALSLTPTASGASIPVALQLSQGRLTYSAPTLRGPGQQFCVNLTSTSITTGLLEIMFRWTESFQ